MTTERTTGRWRGSPSRRLVVPAVLAATALVAAACGAKASGNGTGTTGKATTTTGASATSGPSTKLMVKVATVGSLGKVLVDVAGFTLYHYTPDHGTTIACTGGCASLWPPLTVPAGTTPTGIAGLSTVKRPDGSTQVTFDGHTLYRYSGDSAPGQAHGQGFGGIWFVEHPAGTSTSGGSTTSSSAGGYGGY